MLDPGQQRATVEDPMRWVDLIAEGSPFEALALPGLSAHATGPSRFEPRQSGASRDPRLLGSNACFEVARRQERWWRTG